MKRISVSWRSQLETFLDAVIGPSAPPADQLELPLFDCATRAHPADTISIEPRDPPGGGGLPVPKACTADSGSRTPQEIDRAA